MQQNIRKKLTKFATIGLSSAMLLFSTPLTYADAAETQNTVLTNTQEVANQALQSYLADSNGYMVLNATQDQVNLPFDGELYYGRSLLTEEGKKAWDIIIKELLAFSPSKKYNKNGVYYSTVSDGNGKMMFDLNRLGVKVPASDIKNFNKYLIESEPRMFHILNANQDYTMNSDGTVKYVSIYISKTYVQDELYQNTLNNMEAKTTEYLSLIQDDMTDAQKTKVLFDNFHASTKYVYNSGDGIMTGPLLYGGAICGGYSYAFQYLLQRAGIEAIYVTGNVPEGYHAWNYLEIEGQWYFADSTWGGGYLLKGESSLSYHKPLEKVHFEVLPTLAKENYDLSKAVYVPEEVVEEVVLSEEEVAEQNINKIVQVVKNVLSEVDLSELKAIVAGNPVNTTYAGTVAEVAVKDALEAQFADIDGTFEIVLHNSTDSTTADEMVARDLTITYQLDGSQDTYTYKKGNIKKN